MNVSELIEHINNKNFVLSRGEAIEDYEDSSGESLFEEFLHNKFGIDSVAGETVKVVRSKRSSTGDHNQMEYVIQIGSQYFRTWASYDSNNGIEFYGMDFKAVAATQKTITVYTDKSVKEE